MKAGTSSPLFPLSRKRFVRLKKVQAAAGLWFATYVLAHMGNAAVRLLGPEAADAYLLTVRRITGSVPGEVAWVGAPLVVHAACVAAVVLQERALRRQGEAALAKLGRTPAKKRRKRAPTARIHRATGLSLLVLVPLHLAALRWGAFDGMFDAGGATGYARAARLLAAWPAAGHAAFAALALAMGYHLGYGLWMALVNLGVLGPGRGRRWGWLASAALAAVAMATGFAAVVALAR